VGGGMKYHSALGDDRSVGGGVGCLGIRTTAATGRPGQTSDEVGRLIRNRGCTSASERGCLGEPYLWVVHPHSPTHVACFGEAIAGCASYPSRER